MLVIHIGLAKAGSTRLQTVLAQLEPQLADHGVLYPQSGRTGVAHHPLARPLLADERRPRELWRQVLDLDAPDHTVVISSESFATLDPRQVRDQVGDRDVRVVAYTRPATSRIPSLYSQNTKYGFNLVDFDVFFERLSPETRPHWLLSVLAEEWAAAFGGENVRLRALDKDVLDGGSLESDFFGVLGVPPSLASRVPQTEGDNSSPPWKLLESLRVIHSDAFAGMSAKAIRNDKDSWVFARSALREAQRAAAELGWTARGRYLSHAQQRALVEIHNREVERLELMTVDAEIPAVDLDPAQVRDFMPVASSIAQSELKEFMRLVVPSMLRVLAARARRPQS